MFTDEELLPISALQHLLYCERQCALIHIEQVWSESSATAEGRVLHDHVHEQRRESRGTVRTATGLRLRSLELGLTGQADLVEFHHSEQGSWIPYPVEYKRGRPKTNGCDRVQLCAQALCLEEMLKTTIPQGALFYGQTRHRLDVVFDRELRQITHTLCAKLHQLIVSGITPPAIYEKSKCEQCSLIDRCLPQLSNRRSAAHYLEEILQS